MDESGKMDGAITKGLLHYDLRSLDYFEGDGGGHRKFGCGE